MASVRQPPHHQRPTQCGGCAGTRPAGATAREDRGLIRLTRAASRLPIPPHDRLRGAGLGQVLSTSDFAEWEAATSCKLGHHRGHLVDPDESFEAHYRLGRAGPLQVLHIRGRGRVELERTQQARVVVWLPLLGSSHERLNGTPMAVEPGMALLFRPGDEMLGRTSEDLEGISVLIPE
jgi:hypothetical protein